MKLPLLYGLAAWTRNTQHERQISQIGLGLDRASAGAVFEGNGKFFILIVMPAKVHQLSWWQRRMLNTVHRTVVIWNKQSHRRVHASIRRCRFLALDGLTVLSIELSWSLLNVDHKHSYRCSVNCSNFNVQPAFRARPVVGDTVGIS